MLGLGLLLGGEGDRVAVTRLSLAISLVMGATGFLCYYTLHGCPHHLQPPVMEQVREVEEPSFMEKYLWFNKEEIIEQKEVAAVQNWSQYLKDWWKRITRKEESVPKSPTKATNFSAYNNSIKVLFKTIFGLKATTEQDPKVVETFDDPVSLDWSSLWTSFGFNFASAESVPELIEEDPAPFPKETVIDDSDEESLNHENTESSLKSENNNFPPNKNKAPAEDGQSITEPIIKVEEEVVKDYLKGISFLSSFGFHFASAESVPPVIKEDSEQYLDIEKKDVFETSDDSNIPSDGTFRNL